jgi:hypothetical protein
MVVDGNITCTGTIAAGNFTGLSGGPMTASVDIQTTGNVDADGDVTAGDISLNSHTHIDSVGGTTSEPN